MRASCQDAETPGGTERRTELKSAVATRVEPHGEGRRLRSTCNISCVIWSGLESCATCL
jgi:hypothetical protein